MLLFSPMTIRCVELRNRIAVLPVYSQPAAQVLWSSSRQKSSGAAAAALELAERP